MSSREKEAVFENEPKVTQADVRFELVPESKVAVATLQNPEAAANFQRASFSLKSATESHPWVVSSESLCPTPRSVAVFTDSAVTSHMASPREEPIESPTRGEIVREEEPDESSADADPPSFWERWVALCCWKRA